MNHKDLQQPVRFDQQQDAFKENREQWWSLGEVKSRLSKKKKSFYIKVGASIAAFLLITVLIAVIFMQPEEQRKKPESGEPYYEEPEQTLTPLQKEIQDLKNQLEDADPSVKELSLPNVNMNLTIDRI